MYGESYVPMWAPHVKGSFTPREFDPETGEPEEQKVYAVCGKCGEEFRTTCKTGAVRNHIAQFARLHIHRDPLAPPAAS